MMPIVKTDTNRSAQPVIWAGIVAYRPDMARLGRLVAALDEQVDKIVIFNNGGCSDHDLFSLFLSAQHAVMGSGENVGIGDAMNELSRAAAKADVQFLLTFDQDSEPPQNFASGLLGCSSSLLEAGEQVAAVGPVLVDGRNNREIFPVFQADRFWVRKLGLADASHGALDASILITSGMLINIKAWEAVGEFRGDFFIDHVDTEWCLRAIAKGFSLKVCTRTVMRHQLSDASPRRVFGLLVLKYSPLRRYYAFRNSCCLIRMQHVPQGMKNYLVVTLVYRFFLNLFVDDQRLASLKAMLTGIFHGFSGRMGRR
jgi:rhamnosyltransferase